MQKIFEIQPLIGLANLKLGMSRQESRDLMQDTYTKKSRAENVDCYHNSSFQIFFDEYEKIEFIEISKDEAIKAVFNGKNVLEIPASDLIEEISKDFNVDETDREFGYSFIFPELELSFWRPTIPEDENDEDGKYFLTVGIGKKGYFSNRK